MKNILLALFSFCLLFGTKAEAQSFVTQSQNSDTVYSSTIDPVTSLIIVNNFLKAGSVSSVVIRWHIVSSNIPTNWSFSGFCDNNQCYSGSNVLAGANYVTSPYTNTFYTFDAQFTAPAASSSKTTAYVRLLVEDTVNHFLRYLTFIAVRSPLGIASVSKSDDPITIFPNPSLDELNVLFDNNSGVKTIGIYNLIGKMMNNYTVGGGSAKLDVNSLPSGVYFLRFLDANNQVLATRKFNHQ